MLGYAWRLLTRTHSMWGPSGILALIAALPGAVAATVLAAPVTALLLAGDPLAAIELLPGPLAETSIRGVMAWTAVGIGGLAVLALWTRIYIVAVRLSSADITLRDAVRASRGSWGVALLIYIEGTVVVGTLVGAVLFLLIVAPEAAGGSAGILLAVGIVLAFRSVVRIVMSLALRAATLDEHPHLEAWRRGLAILRERRSESIAAWMTLMAAGVGIWIAGRLMTPVLQDTTFAFPSDSAFSFAREGVHLLFAVPLEALLLTLSFGVWTAVYRGGDALREEPRQGNTAGTDPWLLRALGVLIVLVVIANGGASLIDARYASQRETRTAEIGAREIGPEDVVRPAPVTTELGTSYTVDARLENDRLTWTTTIEYLNQTGETLTDLGIHVYPAAYTRRLEQIPLARDLAANDVNGSFARAAAPGTFEIEEVTIGDETTPMFTLDDTALTIELMRPLRPGDSVSVTIATLARLPNFPERFGVWRDETLLGNWIPVVAHRDEDGWRLDRFGSVGDPFFSSVADYDVTLDLADNEGAVGTGTLIAIESSEPGRQLWRFSAPGVRDAAFAIGRFMRGLEATVGSTRVRSWFPADGKIRGEEQLTSAISAVEAFQDAFGPLPYDEVEVVETGGSFGGMEYPGVVFVAGDQELLEGVPLIPELLEHAGFVDAQRTYVVGHEVAHQWWFSAVGNDQIREPWLDEALAEVSTRLWLQDVEENDRTYRMTTLDSDVEPRPEVLGAGIDRFATNDDYTRAIYSEGAEVLLRLRNLVGPEWFANILSDYYATNVGGIATGRSFLDAVRDRAGDDAVRFLENYL